MKNFMKDIGKIFMQGMRIKNLVGEYKYLKMKNMKACGQMIKKMVKENYITMMVVFFKECSIMGLCMDQENLLISRVKRIMVYG